MNIETFNALLDQAERDFRAEAIEIDLIARPSDSLHDQTGEFDSAGQHPVDLAPDIVEREIAVGILAEASQTLAEIHAARERLSAGTFGRCETCGQQIDAERLQAVPWARRCVAHERMHEAEARGDRNSIDPSPWLPDDTPDDASEASTWDPEDDHPVASTEESAIHEVRPLSTLTA